MSGRSTKAKGVSEARPAFSSPAALRAEFIRMVRNNSHAHRKHEVFRDFAELGALAVSNSADMVHREAREARYMEIVARYSREEVQRFPIMFALLVEMLELEKADHLGQLFMDLELGDHWKGQYFTPYSVSKLMAGITLLDVKTQIEANGFVTISEPACGAGAMVIACADVIHEQGINYQQTMHVTATDIDATAVHMTYLQLSLLHVPAIVVHGNSLAMTEWAHWVTPAHVLGVWDLRLHRRSGDPALRVATAPASIAEESPAAAPALPQVDQVAAVRSRVVAQRAEQLGLFA